jgi:hypothetical protein
MIGRISTALERLAATPLSFASKVPGPAVGWFMHLKGDATQDSPGVYGTSFAVRLLAWSKHARTQRGRELICGGLRYLVQQFRDAREVESGSRKACKQYRKKQDVGHTDFSLTLKQVAVLEASNAVIGLRSQHGDFDDVLREFEQDLDAIAERLKAGLVKEEVGGRILCGWPWHVIDDGQPEIFPTVDAALVLTSPALEGSPRYFTEIHAVINFLFEATERSPTNVHKAIALRGILELSRRGRIAIEGSLANDVISAGEEIDAYAWQEVLHYQAPSARSKISHYKPWVWVCPRIEIAHSLLLVDPVAAYGTAYAVATEVVKCIGPNGARFMQSQSSTFLGNLRAACFLQELETKGLATTTGKALYLSAWARTIVLGLVQRYFRYFVAVPIAWLVAASSQVVAENESVRNVRDLVAATGASLLATWPLWAFLFILVAVLTPGGLRHRLTRAAEFVLVAVVLALAINLLPVAVRRE